jgi:hypothetical protein
MIAIRRTSIKATLVLVILTTAGSCKTTNRANIQSDDPSGSRNNPPDFVSVLTGQVQSLSTSLYNLQNRSNQPLSSSIDSSKARPFLATEMLTPYSDAADDYDRKNNKAASRNLAKVVRTLLQSWNELCKSRPWIQKSWAYPALCRDMTRSSLIDELADFNFLADVVRTIEKENGMPAHMVIYYELRYVKAADQKTIGRLSEICQQTPVTTEQPAKIIASIKSMSKPPLMDAQERSRIVRQGQVTEAQLVKIEEIVATPKEILREIMDTYRAELALFMFDQNPANPPPGSYFVKDIYQAGRRSLISRSFYDQKLKELNSAGNYGSSFFSDSFDSLDVDFPAVNPCAAIAFKRHHDAEMQRFARQLMIEMAIDATNFATGQKLDLLTVARLFNLPMLPYLNQ